MKKQSFLNIALLLLIPVFSLLNLLSVEKEFLTVFANDENIIIDDNDNYVINRLYTKNNTQDEDIVYADMIQNYNVTSSNIYNCNSLSSSHGPGRENGYIEDFLSTGCCNYKSLHYNYGSTNIPYYLDLNTMSEEEAETIKSQIELWNKIVIHDGYNGQIHLYETDSTNDINGKKVVVVSQEDDTQGVGVFNSDDMTVKLGPSRNFDTVLHEFGHVLGLADLDSNDSKVHSVLMGYNRTAASDLIDCFHYQDIQGAAIFNNIHTNHSYNRYVNYNGQYAHFCFYCDMVDISSNPIGDSEHMILAETCEHDYQQMVSVGQRHWIKCTKCYKVIESDFLLKGINTNGTITLEVVGSLNPDLEFVEINEEYGNQIVTRIGNEAFLGSDIVDITYPDTITSIGDFAFKDCSKLFSFLISDEITEIGISPFIGCDQLDFVTFPSNEHFKGEGSILYNYNKTKIVTIANIETSYTVPDSIVEIAPYAFAYNEDLLSIRFAGVPTIGDYAFYNCEKLSEVYFDSYEVPSLGTNAFPSNNFNLYVKYNSADLYETLFENYTNNILSKEIVISFIRDGSIIETYNVYNGSTISYFPPIQEEGYTFEGWYPNEMFIGEPFEINDFWDSEEDLTLYAKLTPNNYIITLNPNGGILQGENYFEVTYGEPFSVNVDIEKEGHTLEGWYDEENNRYITPEGLSTNLWNKTENKTLYAQWSIEKYEIIINNNGTITWLSANGFSNEQCFINYGEEISSINLIYEFKNSAQGYKEGKIFSHFAYENSIIEWEEIPDLGENEQIIEITPIWILEEHTISFNPKYNLSVSPIVTEFDNPISLPILSRDGYTFEGWYEINGNEKITWQTMPDLTPNEQNNGSIQLEAKWTANVYTVSYNKNGGNGTMVSTTHTYDVVSPLRENSFYRTGYSFKGWATSSNGSVQFSNSQNVSNLTTGNSITLYAVWEPMVYNIVYNNLTSSMTVLVDTYTYGVGLTQLPDIYLCEGSKCNKLDNFYGWYSDSNFTQKVTSISKTQTGTITLYAKYDYWVTSTYASYTSSVDDGNLNNQPSFSVDLLLDSIYFDEVKNTSLDTIKIEISFDMWEVKDGYQDLYLYSGENVVWETTIEHGENKKDTTSKHYTFTITIDLYQYYNVDYMDLKFHAHGAFEDDWQFNNFEMSVYFTN